MREYTVLLLDALLAKGQDLEQWRDYYITKIGLFNYVIDTLIFVAFLESGRYEDAKSMIEVSAECA